jgi:hypothetical protein
MNRYAWTLVFFAFVIFFALVLVGRTWPEAKVLSAGTRITSPNGSFYVLATDEFLLTRSDMEQATYALAVLPIDEKLIVDLHTLSNQQARDLASATTWKIIIGVVAAAFGLSVGLLAK